MEIEYIDLGDIVSSTLLLVNRRGNIDELRCPIVAFTLVPVHDLPAHRRVMIEKVMTTADERLVYIISGKPYFHYYFRLGYDTFYDLFIFKNFTDYFNTQEK